MINKIIKNIKWQYAKKKMKYAGANSKIGLDFAISGNKYITIGNNFRGGKHVIIDAIDTYNAKPTCYISCCNEIIIEDGCLFGSNSFICDNSHGNLSEVERRIRPSERPLYSKGAIHIGRNVWVGRNVCIMPGVVLGNNVVVGANSVVTHDVPDNCVVAGAPTRIIRQ